MLNIKHTTEPVFIPKLGRVLITGTINAKCDIMPEPKTVIESVQFWYGEGLTSDVIPCFVDAFESQLIAALEGMHEVAQQLKTPSTRNDTI